MTRPIESAAMIMALALSACAGEEASEEMTDLEAAETSEEMIDLEAAETSEPMTAISRAASTVQSELLADLSQLHEKYVDLAEAIPESDYGWRPADGVRSVSEVFMHVAAANVGIAMRALEAEAPEGADWYTTEAESITDKATVVGAVGMSFDYLGERIGEISEAQMMGTVDVFGLSTVRAAMTFTLAHAHEHLGQSIAYARVNGVTPP